MVSSAALMARADLADGRVSRCAPLACALSLLASMTGVALAQVSPPPAVNAPSAERQALADAAFAQAMDAWHRSAWSEAVEGFSRAMELVPHPSTRYNLARALEHANQVPRAIAEYRRFLEETTDPDDRREVEGRIATLQTRPGEVFVATDPGQSSVTVDADDHPTASAPCHLSLAPGAHVVVVEHEGFERSVRRVVVEPGTSQDLQITLDRRVSLVAPFVPPVVTPPAPDRVIGRRAGRLFSGRAGLITGFAVPRDRPVFAVGVEGGVFVRRSFSMQAHVMWINTDGAPLLIGGDVGWVFPLDEVDLGVYVTGSALLQCESCREGTLLRNSEQFVGGFAVRADVVLHPRIGVGLFGRTAWRNFDLTNSEGLLASGGLSLSLFL